MSTNLYIMLIMISDGVINPIVATIAPSTLPLLYPTKVAVFTPIIPGVACPIAKYSRSSSSVAHFLFSAISRIKIGSIA